MALVTNAMTRYDETNAVREDLANVIYNIAPVDTPLMSNIGRENVKNTFFEWQLDTLAAAVSTNAQLEGDTVTAGTRVATSRVGNYTQISRKAVSTTGTVEAVDKAGMKSLLAYELAKASSELKRDMESTLCSHSIATTGGNTTARTTAGLGSWLINNVNKAAGGTNPTWSGTTQGYPNAARIAGTARAFSETILKDVIKQVWTAGGEPVICMVGPFNKTVASGFAGIASARYNVGDVQPVAIIGTADVYLSDFGQVRIIPNRWQNESDALLIDPEYLSVAYLRNFKTEVMAKTGDADTRLLIVEYGLKVKAEKAHGIAADLLTS
jgi:hypothetical protein